jgi:hypothetical protein
MSDFISKEFYNKQTPSPRTFADLERHTATEGSASEFLASYGAARYKCKKLLDEISRQSENCKDSTSEICSDNNVHDRVVRQLEELKDAIGDRNQGLLIKFLNSMLVLERFNKFDWVRDIVEEVAPKETNKCAISLQPPLEPSALLVEDKQYVIVQNRLFNQCLSELYEKYPNKYVLFQDGKVLLVGNSFAEVVKKAHEDLGLNNIFVKKVSLSEDNQVWTPFT